ncbi:MAG: SprT-like domain-containing protein [Clostridia bacterium]|nr:SprT-like domain-containing protein [Clostridia bacterium]
MFTISDIRREFDRLDGVTGLNTTDVPIRISARMSRALGVCRSRSTEGGGVEAVDVAFADYLCRCGTEEEFLNTVRHEYAHLYNILHDGIRCGHDARWKEVALWLGASPDRLADYRDLLARARKAEALPKRKTEKKPVKPKNCRK